MSRQLLGIDAAIIEQCNLAASVPASGMKSCKLWFAWDMDILQRNDTY